MKLKSIYLFFTILSILSCSDDQSNDDNQLTKPSIQTIEVINIEINSISIIGEVTILGDYEIQDHGFVISENTEPTTNDNKISLGPIDKIQEFQSLVKNLDSNTNYFARSFVIYDDNQILYGNQIPFITLEKNPWNEKASLQSNLIGAVSFVIDDMLYVGTGFDNTFKNQFHKYDYQTDSWSQIADLPSDPRSKGISFQIGDYGYVGLGYNCQGSQLCDHKYYDDIWRYDPSNNTWSEMASLPGGGKSMATSFVIGNKAYITGGGHVAISRDLWEYDPTMNTWEKKASYPGNGESRQISFVINDTGYVGLGWGDYGSSKEIWQYDPVSDTWIEKSNFQGDGRLYATGIANRGYGYVAFGIYEEYNSPVKNYLSDMWKYDPDNDTWTVLSENYPYPGSGRSEMIVAIINDKIIYGLGENRNKVRFDEIWEFDPIPN